jgi:hypothetical protein
MEIISLVVAIVAAIAAVLGAIFAGSQASAAQRDRKDAQAARSESQAARDEARILASEANDAFKRQAVAQERANELVETQLPKDEVVWERRHLAGNRWALENIGSITAFDANLADVTEPPGWIRFDTDTPRDVPRGDALEFLALSAMSSPRPRVQVRWRDGDGRLLTEDFTIFDT